MHLVNVASMPYIASAGGRVHLVVTSPVELGELTSVQVNGEEALNLSTSSPDMTYFGAIPP